MSSLLTTVKEFINPNWVRHSSVPPLEAGLRPNDRLDCADVVAPGFEADDLVVHGAAVALSQDNEVLLLSGEGPPRPLASLSGRVTALASTGSALLAAVDGAGIVEVARDGASTVRYDDPRLHSCVTAMHALPDGDLAVTVGSARYGDEQWREAVVHADRTGCLLRLGRAGVDVLAERLGWPAGVCAKGESEVLVSVSNEHRIDLVSLRGGKRRALLRNLPGFPGRISAGKASADEWLVAFPYVRNRLSELLLEEREFADAMVAQLPSSQWLLPQLRTDNPFTSALQLGQLRVLGVLKPWAPPRTYGLVGVLDGAGRFSSSLHSRVDGTQHGVTAAVAAADGVLVAVRGSRNIVLVKETVA